MAAGLWQACSPAVCRHWCDDLREQAVFCYGLLASDMTIASSRPGHNGHRPCLQAAAQDMSANGFRTVMDIDAVGTFAASRAAFPALAKSPAGCIVNISATLHYGATWWQVR